MMERVFHIMKNNLQNESLTLTLYNTADIFAPRMIGQNSALYLSCNSEFTVCSHHTEMSAAACEIRNKRPKQGNINLRNICENA